MTTTASEETVRRFFAAIDANNLDALAPLCTADYCIHFPGVPVPLDVAGTRQLFAGFLAAFPGITHNVDDLLAEESKVAVRLAIRGTQQSEFQGLPPTGRSVDVIALNLFHLRDGKIAEHWVQYDAIGMLQQLGAMPAPAAPEPTTPN
jgi:steroid delta-isomerase-like uncharacterized protein